jgi:hypothetical protein
MSRRRIWFRFSRNAPRSESERGGSGGTRVSGLGARPRINRGRPQGHLRRRRSSTMCTDIACVAPPCICPRGARNATPANSRTGPSFLRVLFSTSPPSPGAARPMEPAYLIYQISIDTQRSGVLLLQKRRQFPMGGIARYGPVFLRESWVPHLQFVCCLNNIGSLRSCWRTL